MPILLSGFGAAAAAIILHVYFPPSWVALWTTAALLLMTARLALWRAFRRAAPDDAQTARWFAPAVAGVVLSGVQWSLFTLSFAYLPDSDPRWLVLLAAGSAITAGLTSTAPLLALNLTYVLVIGLPLVVTELLTGGPGALLVAAAITLYLGLAVVSAVASYRSILRAVELQLGNEALIADLRVAKDAAEEGSRVKSLFLANMSHELRTPLNAIIGFSDVIKEASFGPIAARYREYAADINFSGRHLLQLLNDILDFSKLEAGHFELVDEAVDVPRLVESCIHVLRGGAEEKQVTLSTAFPAELPALLADELRLRQILLNLLSNAIKFTPEGGAVKITAGVIPTGAMTIAVADTGIGMTAEDVAIAVEPFRQVDARLSRQFPGTGLGLPLARSLTERHGGSLTVASVPGRGTVVTLIFPPSRTLAPD